MFYIHIPFCKSFCAYCDFYSSANSSSSSAVFEAIATEWQMADLTHPEFNVGKADFGRIKANFERGSLYFGGGTPSLFQPEKFLPFIEHFKSLPTALSEDSEITFEANPDDLNPLYLNRLHNIGINRLSIGIQSFQDIHLKTMRRRHTCSQAIKAFEQARTAGFNNISLDLIFGFPGLDRQSWQSNLEQCISLRPNHISAYQLSIESGSAWGRQWAKGQFTPLPEEECEAQYKQLQEVLDKAGYIQYEISNFCLPGFHSRHNSGYWNGTPYLGLGPAAHSFNGRQRWWNIAQNSLYIKGIQNGKPSRITENLGFYELCNERLMLSLRRNTGLDLGRFEADFGTHSLEALLNSASAALDGGHLIKKAGSLRIPPQYFFIADAIIAPLFRVPDKKHPQKSF